MSKIFEKITEIVGWLQIVASPLLICGAIAAVIYFSSPSFERLLLAAIMVLIGLTVGIIFANKIMRTKGTVWFMSRISATPELDENDIKPRKKTKN
ncbi:hypothetical protein [Flavobacterium magnum]|uniref:hypothetical protein n=1 Tax=Flavobacterium magnum TaxID=2162713 RepID=UPI0011B1EBB6|nr:hypothetical protein [Flavobacterium magnum]